MSANPTSTSGPAVSLALVAADLDCRDFPDRASAQATLDADPSDPFRLDADNDGRACESFTYARVGVAPVAVSRGGAAAADSSPAALLAGRDLDCRDFPDRLSAQAVLDADPSDPFRLDADSDGRACESFSYSANPDGTRLTGRSGSALALTGAEGVTMLGGAGGALLVAGLAAVVLVRRLDPSSVRAAGRHRTNR